LLKKEKKEKKEPKFVFHTRKKTHFFAFCFNLFFWGLLKNKAFKKFSNLSQETLYISIQGFFAKRKKVKRSKK
jgi:hypothetical protein